MCFSTHTAGARGPRRRRTETRGCSRKGHGAETGSCREAATGSAPTEASSARIAQPDPICPHQITGLTIEHQSDLEQTLIRQTPVIGAVVPLTDLGQGRVLSSLDTQGRWRTILKPLRRGLPALQLDLDSSTRITTRWPLASWLRMISSAKQPATPGATGCTPRRR
jgi:hypothetical protein